MLKKCYYLYNKSTLNQLFLKKISSNYKKDFRDNFYTYKETRFYFTQTIVMLWMNEYVSCQN